MCSTYCSMVYKSFCGKLRNSAAQFVKFCGIVIPNSLHSAASRKLKEFIVTCNTKTNYIRPLILITIIKVSLQ